MRFGNIAGVDGVFASEQFRPLAVVAVFCWYQVESWTGIGIGSAWRHFAVDPLFLSKKLRSLLLGVIRRENASLRYCACLIISCIPAALVYLLFQQQLDAMFEKPLACSLMLMITGLLLLSTRFLCLQSRDEDPKWRQALGIGLVQTVALLPGISRSGSTITTARWFGISALKAAEFSFLMSIPLLAGGILLKGKEICKLSDTPEKAAIMLAGCALAALVGWLSLKLLTSFQLSGKFWYFGCYCLFLGTSALLFILLG